MLNVDPLYQTLRSEVRLAQRIAGFVGNLLLPVQRPDLREQLCTNAERRLVWDWGGEGLRRAEDHRPPECGKRSPDGSYAEVLAQGANEEARLLALGGDQKLLHNCLLRLSGAWTSGVGNLQQRRVDPDDEKGRVRYEGSDVRFSFERYVPYTTTESAARVWQRSQAYQDHRLHCKGVSAQQSLGRIHAG